MEDSDIIKLYWHRSETAILETKKKYHKLCSHIADNILHSREDSEECVQDTYLAVWNRIPEERPYYFRAFVCKITRNISFFSIKGNAIVPISNIRHIKRKLHWKKHTGWINADMISDQENQYVYNLTQEDDVPDNGQYTFSLSQDDAGEYWVTASAESQMEPYSYPLKYNVNTKKLTDVFGDIMI